MAPTYRFGAGSTIYYPVWIIGAWMRHTHPFQCLFIFQIGMAGATIAFLQLGLFPPCCQCLCLPSSAQTMACRFLWLHVLRGFDDNVRNGPHTHDAKTPCMALPASPPRLCGVAEVVSRNPDAASLPRGPAIGSSVWSMESLEPSKYGGVLVATRGYSPTLHRRWLWLGFGAFFFF